MSFLRNVLADLIEKRLWPVAIALVAALVAVPIVLGGSSDATPAAPTAVADASSNSLTNHRDAARAAVVSLEEQAAGKVTRSGAVHDPFVQHHQPKADDANVKAAVTKVASALNKALSGSNGGSSDSSADAGSGSSGTTPPAAAPTTPITPTTTKKPASDVVYGVKLKFGESGAEKTYENPARLTPLPSSDNPFFVYLGLQDDKKHAVFLIDGEAVPTGDGHCDPSPQECEKLTMEAGDLEFFELQTGTAGVVEYQLELMSVSKYKAKTKVSAAKARARESKAGREHLREVVATDPTALDGWDYSRGLGLLIRKDPVAAPDVANVPDTVADGAAGQAVQQTSTVLTVPTS